MAQGDGVNVFETSRQLGRIPVVGLRGVVALERTAWLKQLLRHPLMQGTVVLTSEVDRAAELDYARVQYYEAANVTTAEGCLCCGMNRGLGDALRALFLRVLSKRARPIDRVLIDATVLEPEQLAFTFKHAPFLGQRYCYQMTLTVVGANAFMGDASEPEPSQTLVFDENTILRTN